MNGLSLFVGGLCLGFAYYVFTSGQPLMGGWFMALAVINVLLGIKN